MNKKGFSTVELLVSFIIITFVGLAMFNAVLDLLDKIELYQDLSEITILKGTIVNSMQKDLKQKKLYGYASCGTNCYDITYQDLSVKRLKTDNTKNTIQYGSIVYKLPDENVLNGDFTITNQTFAADTGDNNSILKILIPINNPMLEVTNNINIVHQYDNRDLGGLPPF